MDAERFGRDTGHGEREQKMASDADIDLREVRADELGFPTVCPQCGHGGYLDSIDLRNNRQHEHCVACQHRWVDVAAR